MNWVKLSRDKLILGLAALIVFSQGVLAAGSAPTVRGDPVSFSTPGLTVAGGQNTFTTLGILDFRNYSVNESVLDVGEEFAFRVDVHDYRLCPSGQYASCSVSTKKVDEGSFSVEYRGDSFEMQHVSADTWKATGLTAQSIGNDKSVSFNVSGTSFETDSDLTGFEDRSATYSVKDITGSINLGDGVVERGDSVSVSGSATLQPDGTDVSGSADLFLDGSSIGSTTVSSGSYSSTVTAPEAIGSYSVRAEFLNSNGINGTASTSLEVRNLTFQNYRVSDSVLNPGEQYTFKVDITEFDGSTRYDVTSGSFDVDYRGSTYSLSHVSGSTWSTTVSANSNLENGKSVSFNVSGTSTVNDISGSEQDSVVYDVRNGSLDFSLDSRVLNSSEKIGLSGSLMSLPSGSGLSSEIKAWVNTGNGYNLLDSLSPNAVGSFDSSIKGVAVAGTHLLKLNTSTSEGITGWNTTSFNVTLNVSGPSTLFASSGNAHADVDSGSRVLELETDVSNSSDSTVDSVWTNITLPDGNNRVFYLNNQSSKDGSGVWNRSIGSVSEFGDMLGKYEAVFRANTSRGIGSDLESSTFFIENVSISRSLSDYNVTVNEETSLSGQAILQPYGAGLNGSVNVDVEDGVSKSFSASSGSYSGILSSSGVGGKTANLSYATSNGVVGNNSIEFNVFNITASIDSVKVGGTVGKKVFKDSDSDTDLNFTDTVSADSNNPYSIKDLSINYETPGNWNKNSYSPFIGSLSPGTAASNSPNIDIGQDAALGPHQVNISTSTKEGLKAEDNTTVEVWTRSESDYLNLADGGTISRNKEFFDLKAEVLDTVNGSRLEGVNTTVLFGTGYSVSNVSNASGVAVLSIDVSKLPEGEKALSMYTHDEPELYVNSSETTTSNAINIFLQGNLQRGTESSINPVQRKGSNTTLISGTILDSTGSTVDAEVTADVNGTSLGSKQTGSDGTYSFTFDPADSKDTGIYNATITAKASNFADLSFKREVEVRGSLDITNTVSKSIVQRGTTEALTSQVVSDRGNSVTGNVSWKLDDSRIGSGKDTDALVPSSLSRGSYILNASTGRRFFDDDSDSKNVDVYGLASVELTPDNFSIKPDNQVTFKAKVINQTGGGIGNYPVQFRVNGTKYSRTTNSSGFATFDWNSQQGTWNISSSISSNQSKKFNISTGYDESTVFVGKKVYLDEFKLSEKDIYRHLKTPYRTVISLNLTETTSGIDRRPVSGETVTLTINGSDSVSCTTGQDGSCKNTLYYNPTGSVSTGKLDVVATTDRAGWTDVDVSKNLTVRGKLTPQIDNPSSDKVIGRGSTVDLNSTLDTFVGGAVDADVNWTLDGNKIESGEDAVWNVPAGISTGKRTLKIKADDRYLIEGSDSIPVYILGNANVNLLSPDNSSKKGYASDFTTRCNVESQGLSVKNYPVEFVDNRTGSMKTFATADTKEIEGSTVAEATWNPPDRLGSFKMGCRIDNNRTLGYSAKDSLDTKVFETKDNKPPTVDNLSVQPSKVDPGDSVDITFNATDQIGVSSVDVQVNGPNLNTFDVEETQTVGTGYNSSFDTDTSSQRRGSYTVKVISSDTSGNTGISRKTFTVDPGGRISLGQEEFTAGEITQSNGFKGNVTAHLLINETGSTDVNISASSSSLDFNTSRYSCGQVSKGNYCNRTFEVTVPPGTSPTEGVPLFASMEGVWNTSTGDSSVRTLAEFNVLPNPEIQINKGNISQQVRHGGKTNFSYSVDSIGNTPVEKFDIETNSSGIEDSWLKFYGLKDSIEEGNSNNVDIQVSPPIGTSTGDYETVLNFSSQQAEGIIREITASVPVDRGYTAPSTKAYSAIKGSKGSLGSLKINSTGNTELAITPSFVNGPDNTGCGDRLSADATSVPKQSTREINISYDFQGFGFTGSCSPKLKLKRSVDQNPSEEVTLNLDILEFNIQSNPQSRTLEPGEVTSLKFNASIGGSRITENISYSVSVNGKDATINSSTVQNKEFRANYTIPEVEDAESHDVNLTVRNTKYGISKTVNFENLISVPDITPPKFASFNIPDQKPGSDLELDINVSDNSDAGVKNVSVKLNSSNSSNTYYLNENSGNWTATVENISKGVYTAEFNAEDYKGLNTKVKKEFRVSEPVLLDGFFTTPTEKPEPGVNLKVKDTKTGDIVKEETSENGKYNLSINKGRYNVEAEVDGSSFVLEDTLIQNGDELKADELDSAKSAALAPSSAKARVMGLAVKKDMNSSSGKLTFNYSDRDLPAGTIPSNLKVAHCKSLNYSTLSCDSELEVFNVSALDVNRARKTIELDVPGFSSYTLFAPSEQDDNQTQQDPPQQEQQEPDDSGGGGGGGGLSDSQYQELQDSTQQTQQEVRELSESLNQTESSSVGFSSNSITAKLKPGESKVSSITITNKNDEVQVFNFEAKSPVARYMDFRETIDIKPGESKTLKINITAPASQLPGSYSGSMKVTSSSIDANIPVNIQVLPPDKKLLDLSVDPVFESVQPGKTMKVETTFNNQGYARNVDVTARLNLRDPETNETVSRKVRTVAVGTTLTKVFKLSVPEDIPTRKYTVRATASYSNLNVSQAATAVTPVKIATPFWQRTILGITFMQIGGGLLIALISSLLAYSGYAYRKKKLMKKKRYMENIDLDTIPSGGDRQGFVGELAEMGKRTFVNIDDLKTHALIAGATGSGKTVTGQVMVEEALEEGTNVIVLDPTAQWTGYLRENEESGMLQLLQEFGMSKDDARSYDGNIRAVEPDEKEIDITPYLEEDEEGNIIIFSLHKLESKNIEEFVDTTIQQIFDANLPERDHLETLVVYDEVHRLLEKFGGSGEGLKQLERGAREFRKWGVGMVLLSQVISDFSGEIRANIGTTVQMRTQYDDDLERMKDKFGMDTVKSIAKAEQGSGMLENSDYNHGRPYFVNFRPLKHSPHRLSDEELEDYEEYNRRIDEMEEKVDELEQEGEEVYEYRNKIKLAKRNLRKGSFSLIDIYLDELEGDLNQ